MTALRDLTAHRDLTAALAVAVACALIALLSPLQAPRVIAAVPLLLLLPGYAITAACFGRDLPAGSLVLALSVGLSVATLALGAVVLEVLPWGLREWTWIALVLLVIAAASLVASRRRGGRAGADPRRTLLAPLPPVRAPDGALLALAGLVLAAVVALSSTLLSAENAIGYTRLWMLPSRDDAAVPHVRVGIVNEQKAVVDYRLVALIGDERRAVRRLRLAPGQRRVFRFRARPPSDAPIEVRALLYRERRPDVVYRRTSGWIPAR